MLFLYGTKIELVDDTKYIVITHSRFLQKEPRNRLNESIEATIDWAEKNWIPHSSWMMHNLIAAKRALPPFVLKIWIKCAFNVTKS